MIHIVIDTSIFSKDLDRTKASFKTIQRLAKENEIKLHIPYFVKYEVITQLQEKCQLAYSKANKGISNLLKFVLPEKQRQLLNNILGNLKSNEDNILNFPASEFTGWATAIGAEVYPIAEKHGALVAEDYFKGKVPFKVPKNRNDIPDAFIWRTILDIQKEHKDICVIAADGAFEDACKKKGICFFNSLDAFLNSDICEPLLREENNVRLLYKFLSEFKDHFVEFVEKQIDEKLNGEIVDSIEIPSDNHQAIIYGHIDIESIEFKFSEKRYYGAGVIIIPFTAEIKSHINYPISKANYYELAQHRSEEISISELNDHYFDATEKYEIQVDGAISINIEWYILQEEKFTEAMAKDLIYSSLLSIDSIDDIYLYDKYEW